MPSYFELIFATAGLFLAGIVKGTTGLGYASCALPFLVATVGLPSAMAIILLPALATNISLAVSAGHLRETAQRFAPLYLAMLPGIAFGLMLLQQIALQHAVATLGAVMILYALFALAKPEIRIPAGWQTPLQVPTGLLNGMVTGLTGSQVMPLFPYVMGLNLEPARTVQAINLAVLIATTILAAGLALSGLMTPLLLALSLAATAPALVGVEIGNRLRPRIPVARFRAMTLYVLLTMGVGMLLRL
jgi:uncharacterized membrane protein YfcA